MELKVKARDYILYPSIIDFTPNLGIATHYKKERNPNNINIIWGENYYVTQEDASRLVELVDQFKGSVNSACTFSRIECEIKGFLHHLLVENKLFDYSFNDSICLGKDDLFEYY